MSMKPVSVNIAKRLDALKTGVQDLPKDAHAFFVKATPIDTGNARASTDLVGDEIQANYDYANALNTGWSRQAPNGMTGQTIDHVRDQIKKL